MLLTSLLLAAAQAAAPSAAQAPMLAAEMIERPAAVAQDAFLDQLIREAGAQGWQRQVRESSVNGFAFRMVGLSSDAAALAFFLPVGESAGTGRICRIRQLQLGRPSDEESLATARFCLEGLGATLEPGELPVPQTR